MSNEKAFIVALIIYILTLFAHEAIEHKDCMYNGDGVKSDSTFVVSDSLYA